MQAKDAIILLDAIEKDRKFEPTAWATQFLQSIRDRVDIGMPLTGKQGAKLQEIYRQSQDSECRPRYKRKGLGYGPEGDEMTEDEEQDALDVNDF